MFDSDEHHVAGEPLPKAAAAQCWVDNESYLADVARPANAGHHRRVADHAVIDAGDAAPRAVVAHPSTDVVDVRDGLLHERAITVG